VAKRGRKWWLDLISINALGVTIPAGVFSIADEVIE
jgi:hypothetical protein